MTLDVWPFLLSAGLSAGALAAETLPDAAGVARPERLQMRLSDAVERALTSSPQLAQRRALERAAAADARGARAARLPSLDVSGGYTHQSDVPALSLTLPNGQTETLFPNLPENYHVHAGAGWALFSGGRTSGLIRAADGEREASGRDVDSARQDLILETRTAYWSLVSARQMEQVLRDALAAYDAHLHDAGNRERFGMAARNEVLAVQVERDRAELALLRAQNTSAVSEANLARLTGVEPGQGIDPAEPLVAPSAEPENGETLVARALDARPERAALLARLAAAQARVRVEQSVRWPLVTAAAGYDYANPNRLIMPPSATWKDTWDVGVNVALTLFDGGKASAAVAAARARCEAIQAQIEDLSRDIRLQVTQHALDLKAAVAAVTVAERGLDSARENRRVAADRYREGLIASSDLLDAEVALLRAGLDLTDALAQARLAEAALERAVGR